MNIKFMLMPDNMIMTQAIQEVIECNKVTSLFGLSLTNKEAMELVQTRTETLKNFGRVEFGGGVIDKLILEFCDSPYLSQNNYCESLHDLIETFYYFKNESLDNISDDELIKLMKDFYDDRCNGSIELLQGRELEKIAHNIRYDIEDYTDISEFKEDAFEEEDYYE